MAQIAEGFKKPNELNQGDYILLKNGTVMRINSVSYESFEGDRRYYVYGMVFGSDNLLYEKRWFGQNEILKVLVPRNC